MILRLGERTLVVRNQRVSIIESQRQLIGDELPSMSVQRMADDFSLDYVNDMSYHLI